LDLLAAGVPVATQRVGEYGTYVVDGVSGLLAEPGDAAGLAERVVRLLHSPELAGRLGQGAAATLRAQHAWPGLARSALAAYQAAGAQVS